MAKWFSNERTGALLLLTGLSISTPAVAQSWNGQGFALAPQPQANAIFQEVMVEPEAPVDERRRASLRRQVVNYPTNEPAGTIIVDTPNTYLYYVLGSGKAVRYGIGVGREGFKWSGVKSIERKAEWPDWHPPAEMIARQPYLPRFMAGGASNPLGARAMYLGGTVYRIHGTNSPNTIGQHVSSGCIRMLNEDVVDLYERVRVGTKVVVLPDYRSNLASRSAPARAIPVTQSQPNIVNSFGISRSAVY